MSDFALNDETFLLYNTRKIQPKKILDMLSDKIHQHPFYMCLVAEAKIDLKDDHGYLLINEILTKETDPILCGFSYYIIKEWSNCIKTLETTDHYFGNFLLGVCYQNGFGVVSDGLKALEYYTNSWNQGYINSCSNIGMIYQSGNGVEKSQEKAFYYFDLASKKNFGIAIYNVGYAYFHGLGVTKDHKTSFQKMLQAAECGCSNSFLYMGCFYHQGVVCEKNYVKAVEYFTLASEHEVSYANYFLGICYYNGDGCTRDRKKAFEYYKLAASQGVQEAREYLSTSYIWGTDVIAVVQYKIEMIKNLHPKRLRYSGVSPIAIDKHGGIYVGDYNRCLYFAPDSLDCKTICECQDSIWKVLIHQEKVYVSLNTGVIDCISNKNRTKYVSKGGVCDFVVCKSDFGTRYLVVDGTEKNLDCIDVDSLQKIFSHHSTKKTTSVLQIATNLVAIAMNQGIEIININDGQIKTFVDLPDDDIVLSKIPHNDQWISSSHNSIKIWEDQFCIDTINFHNFLNARSHDRLGHAAYISGYIAVVMMQKKEKKILLCKGDEIKVIEMENVPILQLECNDNRLIALSEKGIYKFDIATWLNPLLKVFNNQNWLDVMIYTSE